MLIKFALRHNLIYPLQFIIYQFLSHVVLVLIQQIFGLKASFAYIPIVFSAEFLGGLTFYFLQKLSFKRKSEKKESYFMSIKLIQNEAKNRFKQADNYFKIVFLIFIATYIDFVQFLFWTKIITKFQNKSTSLILRLNGHFTTVVALYYIYALKLSIQKHHKFSLVVIGICLPIILSTEFLFQKFDIFLSIGEFFMTLGLILLNYIYSPVVDLIEKYLFEYDYLNPFLLLMYEGLIGICISFIFCFTPSYLKDIKLVVKKIYGWDLFLFLFLIILYFILSALRNTFKMVTTKIYSPMIRNLTDNVLNPISLIFYFLVGYDFIYENKRDYLHFSVNLILSIIISICSCIYCEFIILFCCGLETNTHDQISKRSLIPGLGAFYDVNENDEESEAFDNFSSHTDNKTERTEYSPFVLY